MSADRNLEIEEVKRRTAELEQIQARNGQPALVAPDSGGAQRGSEERCVLPPRLPASWEFSNGAHEHMRRSGKTSACLKFLGALPWKAVQPE